MTSQAVMLATQDLRKWMMRWVWKYNLYFQFQMKILSIENDSMLR
jgi:hypothetical protein